MKFSASAPVWRIRILSILILLFCGILLSKLFFIQAVKNQYYLDMADRQYMRPASRIFDRGNIFFTSKDGGLVAAATTKQGYVVAINPKLVTNASSTFNKLSAVFLAGGTSLDATDFMSKANKKEDPYEVLADRVDGTLAKKLTALNMRELMVSKERWRYYPAGTSASHVVGFMGFRGNDYIGRYGLEKGFDDVLSRTSAQTFTSFFAEIFRGFNSVSADATSTNRAEGDIVLTIEPIVQNFLEKSLAGVLDKYQAETVGGIIIDPKTGEIVAMALAPNFNPGEKQADLALLSNPLVEGRYEMGSIVKALTMASGLDTGMVTAGTKYKDTGCLTLNTMKICNYDGKARGVVSMQEVLNQSLNTGVTFVQTKVGKPKFKQYFQNFGLGEKTGIDLPGEISGSLSTLDNNQDIEFATASFGQGISTTPIEITRALSSLANGGYLVSPHVVKEIRYNTGLKMTVAPVVGRQVISTTTSREITRMLSVVVDTKLANGKAKLEHTTVAAKTGTAQYVDPATRKYYPDRYLHSFFGYFPAYDSRFLVFLYVKHPQGVQYASETLTQPFLDITKFLINYYNIPPDR